MARANFPQQKRQREPALQQRRDERMARHGERPTTDAPAPLAQVDPKPDSDPA